jgi:transposase-like protein
LFELTLHEIIRVTFRGLPGGWMMTRMLSQLPLSVPPVEAIEVAEGVHLVRGRAGGVVWVHGLATFAWDEQDEAGRRLAAVQLVRLKAASKMAVAAAFGVTTVTLWRWRQALADLGVAGLAATRPGPKGPSKLGPSVVARIRELDRAGATLMVIAAEVGVSTFSVRNALGRTKSAAPEAEPAAEAEAMAALEPDRALEAVAPAGVAEAAGEPVEGLVVLPDPVNRDGERVLARWGLLGEGATPVFAPGARYPLAGLLLALPGLEATGLLATARATYRRLRDGFYGLDVMLLVLVFLALLREPRAEGATRVPPGDLGRVLGLDRAPEVKTIRRKLGELAAAGKAGEWMLALARHHAAARPDALGFLYVDGHTRVYTGTRQVQKTHVARLKFPAPATLETWVTDAEGDPLFVVLAEPSASLASELVRLAPQLRAIVGAGRRTTVCFDRGGWSPAVFADLIEAGFDILTYRKGSIPDLPDAAFTTITFTDDRARERTAQIADGTTELAITDGKRKGQTVALRQVTRRKPDRHGALRQTHILTSRTDLTAAQVAHRMFSRWREENYFRYARTHFDLDALDSYAATPDDPDRAVPNPARAATKTAVTDAEIGLAEAETARDTALLALRTPAPGQSVLISNQILNALSEPVEAARNHLDRAQSAHKATPARVRLGDLAPDMVVLDTETKLITHAVRMAAYNTETTLASALHGHYARADDEAYTLIREALAGSGDIHPRDGVLHVRLDPLSAPRRTTALATLCEQLNATRTRYPGTDLILNYEMKPHP